ncbi:MAG: hypothetical protein IPL87_00410 [Candidatus Moraniibacteriota bacterium]|nr:MAG: hypothetical protein IPL87_00410 [Candidatus Moranbacteria bacterium]
MGSGVGEQRAEVRALSRSGAGQLRTVFSPKAVLDGVSFIESDTVVFLANTSGTPVALKNADNTPLRAGFTYIMMPIQK